MRRGIPARRGGPGTRLGRGLLAACLLLGTVAGCTGGDPPRRVLRVLASAELADMRPILDELRAQTGVELQLDLTGTVDAANALDPGAYHHDLAWLSSDRYFRLKLAAGGYTGAPPLSTSIMTSPVAVGVTPAAARALRAATPDQQVSWADLADSAATGSLRFAMADPRRSNSGLAALIGVATAAAGHGGALRPEDVTCDRLRGFFTGHTVSAPDSAALVDQFVAHRADLDAVVNYESALLALNASGRLPEPLELVYPQDGLVISDYPLLLLDPAQREAYDTAVAWLRSPAAQRQIMERTLRRPVDPTVARDPRLAASMGNALYYPDAKEVVDRLLDRYADPALHTPTRVVFTLDFSGSMRGRRIAALREAFAALAGADRSSGGKFGRIFRGERFTVIRFGGRVLDERDLVVNSPADLDTLRSWLDVDSFDDSTAVWSALDHAYDRAAAMRREDPRQQVSIVLMTDGENNAGISLDRLLPALRDTPVRTYAIAYGEADRADLDRVARTTGGFAVDAGATSLLTAFKEIRGC
ncbi:VWA domain-containing protein [Catellatospora sp. TT07R-123]|uniref:substrate-binding and vWA domain-containing protein n=1 Tax=Catellatospora sp. TT07R-123 TaxID=2733863 RepID=UPI001B12B426|nr:VWA domain-containing protein [Catellatospora sp. TT07R-123]GHJ44106.1 VWA domain-containing protein [Catellatospora sp. TT07R-123]